MGDTPRKTEWQGRVQTAQFVLSSIFTTIIALVIGFVWYMSPLGLGFQDWPDDPLRRDIALTIYRFSYFIGLPMLALGQIGALILGAMARRRAAYWLSIGTIGTFGISVAIVLWMIESGA